MFVLIFGVVVLALVSKYGPSILPNKAQKQKLGNILDWVLFVLAAMFVFGLMSGGD